MKSIKIQCKVNDSLTLDKLTSFQGSIKSISQENHEKLKTRILKKGFRYPLHIWVDPEAKSNILDTHQRLAVLCDLEKEGYSIPPLPVHYVYCDTLEEAKEEVLAISSCYGEWEREELEIYLKDFDIELGSLSLSSVLLDLGDFKSEDIYIGEERETLGDDEKSPSLQKETYVSQEGTLWQLNDHLLLCGSSTHFDNLKALLGEADLSLVLVFSDPPYGIDLLKREKQSIGRGGTPFLAIEGDRDTHTAKEFVESCKDLGLENFVIWGGNYFSDFLDPSPVWFSWFKGIGEGLSFSQCELAWTSFKSGGVDHYPIHWCGGGMEGGWRDNMAKRIHPNQKPVLLMEECLRRRGKDFKIILDGFCGSGSFLIGAEKTAKKYIGFELMRAYCDASVKRWVEWMQKNGRPITLLKDGNKFTDYSLL